MIIPLNSKKLKFYIVILIFLNVIFYKKIFSQNNTNILFQDKSINQLYENFSKSYTTLDTQQIANCYANEAWVINLYTNGKPNLLQGKENIRKYYKDFFDGIQKNNQKLRLTFKVVERKKNNTPKTNIADAGYYKLEVLENNIVVQTGYGKFATVLHLKKKRWIFETDATSDAKATEFEEVNGVTIPEK